MVRVMSTDEAVRLSELDKERDILIGRLPWWKKFYRRFMTGDSFVAWNLSSVFSWVAAFPAGFTAGLSATALAAKYPAAWATVVKTGTTVQQGWAAGTAFVAGLVKVAFATGS